MTKGPSRTFAALALVVCAAVVLPASRAHAIDATSDEVRGLAQRATFDPAALERLRSIDSVDGRPADLGRALSGSDQIALGERLRTLAQSGAAPPVDSGSARGRAREVLSDRKFKETEPPRPFRGAFDRLGDWLDRNLTKPLGRVFRALVGWLPGGETTFWVLLVAAVVGLAVFVTIRLARRRARAITVETHGARISMARDDPKDLERRAAQAEANGDLTTAIRLRFAAGLLRLDQAGALSYEPSLTAGQVRRRLRLAPFDRVSVSFEAVAYGGRAPDVEDVEISKTGWGEVLRGLAA